MILVTGATGYIGRRLATRLVGDGRHRVRLFVRNASKLDPGLRLNADVVEGDTFDPAALRAALKGVRAAYYLIHSMGAGRDFPELDRRSAREFRDACVAADVERIVYLGGLGNTSTPSPHLRSRLETGEILSGRPDRIRTLWFRAGVIIGSGSASFEIIRHLVQKLPVMITPRFVSTRTQPIAVADVIEYLVRGADVSLAGNAVVDIGSEVMTFRDMLLRTSRVMGLKRRLIPVPVFTPRLASHWLVLVTPVPYRISGALVDGLSSETVAGNDLARGLFPEIRPAGFDDAVRGALDETVRKEVLSAWCDSSAMAVCDIRDRDTVSRAVLKETRTFPFEPGRERRVFDIVEAIGGETGWYAHNWLWRLRGFVDKVLGGPGLNRGRRDSKGLRPGDSVDFWKVVDIKKGRRLLLANQMRVPGEAWLEFRVETGRLIQTAHFHPRGLAGRLYWLAMTPFHALIFGAMGRAVVHRAVSSPD